MVRSSSRHALSALALALCAASAGAWTPHGFTVHATPPTGGLQLGGTSSVGPILSTDPNGYAIYGDMPLELGHSGTSLSRTRMTGGDMFPGVLYGYVPPAIPGWPNAAEITVWQLRFELVSSTLPVSGNQFNGPITVRCHQGTVRIVPWIGDTVWFELAGVTLDAQPTGGSFVVPNPGRLNVSVDIDASVQIPGVATVRLFGNLDAQWTCPTPVRYCQSATNSTGGAAEISWSGQPYYLANDFRLHAHTLPPNQNGLFYAGTNEVNVPFGDGFRCVGGATARFALSPSSAAGTTSFDVDLFDIPSAVASGPGATVRFQYWYRDPAAGGAGFNLTDALRVRLAM